MIYIRDGILTATVLALIYILDNRPRPVKDALVPYCAIEYKTAQKHPLTGKWVTGWARGYGPCDLQDRYFQI